MRNAAVGFCVHSGWSALVVVSAEKDEPVVLCRERIALVETARREFRQPYHNAKRLSRPAGWKFILRVRSEARRLAYRALRGVKAELNRNGRRLNHGGMVQASGRDLPDLASILRSHALIHTAEGELFREAVDHASARCGIKLLKVREKELRVRAAEVLGLPEASLQQRLKEIGRPWGPPWGGDEKRAALVAWLAGMKRGRCMLDRLD